MEYKTLKQVFEENKRQPLKVVSENNTVITVVGCHFQRAYGWLDGNPENVKTFDAEREHWKVWTKPDPVPHWQAVRTTGSSNTSYSLSGTLYFCEEQAKNGLGCNYIRLAKELEPIMMLPSEWVKRY